MTYIITTMTYIITPWPQCLCISSFKDEQSFVVIMLYHYSWGIITLLNNDHMHMRLWEIYIFCFLSEKEWKGQVPPSPLSPLPGHLSTCVKSFKRNMGVNAQQDKTLNMMSANSERQCLNWNSSLCRQMPKSERGYKYSNQNYDNRQKSLGHLMISANCQKSQGHLRISAICQSH